MSNKYLSRCIINYIIFHSDLKAEVHRKNSSESSDDVPSAPVVEVVTNPESSEWKSKRHEKRPKHQRSKTDGFVSVSIKDEKHSHSSFKKLYHQGLFA